MKRFLTYAGLIGLLVFTTMGVDDCHGRPQNTSALDEQAATEINQQGLLQKQPPPKLSWSLERDNLIKRSKLMNDRATMFFMYVFIEGVADPIGYYQINKVSSVDSQLTNTQQIVWSSGSVSHVLPSPAEDGSYGTNGAGVFGFTPEDVYIEHNMHYLVSTIPLQFARPVIRLAVVNTPETKKIVEDTKKVMGK